MNNNSWFKKENPFQTVIGYGGGATGFSAFSSSASKTYVDDVFSTYLYTGDGQTTKTITNDINLSGKGGLVWVKIRNQSNNHILSDTTRGITKFIESDSTAAEVTSNRMSSVSSTGFVTGSNSDTNANTYDYASWTFRKQKGFFDIVTYTGNGSNRDLSHSLGSIPGCIMVKRTDAVNEWAVYHRSIGTGKFLMLDSSTAALSNANFWYNGPTATTFGIGPHDYVNINGGTYVAYIFAGGESTAATACSVSFDGSNDYLYTSSAHADMSFGTGDFTIEQWFRYDGSDIASTNDTLIDTRNGDSGGTSDHGWLWWVRNNGKLALYTCGSDGQGYAVESNTVLSPGQWYHAAVTRSGNTYRLFLNGVLDDTNTQSYSADAGSNFYIGYKANYSGSSLTYWNGLMSNVRIVKGTAVYTSSFKPPTEPLTNITNTKFLWAQSSTVTTGTVNPMTLTNSGTTASIDSPFDDPEGFKFGEDEDQNIIKTGSYVGTGSAGLEVNLGWEPSFIMVKSASAAENWEMYDSMRGIATGGDAERLKPNTDSSEDTNSNWFALTADGFIVNSTSGTANTTGDTYLFLAIRRPDGYVGKPPELGTGVFAMDTGNDSSTIPAFDSNFIVDYALYRKPATSFDWTSNARLTGTFELITNGSAAETSGDPDLIFDSNIGYAKNRNDTYQSWMFKRHAGFDVVAYEGDGNSGYQVRHSLSKTPEMIWVKKRNSVGDWAVYHKGLNGGTTPQDYWLKLNDTDAEADNVNRWNDTAPTTTAFSLGNSGAVNSDGDSYLAMLFSSVDSISKVGYYVGNSTADRVITTGFQPRFIIIRRADAGDQWYVIDSLSGDTKQLRLNSDLTQQTTTVQISFTSTGFQIPAAGTGPYNSTGEEIIYYAHA